MGILGVHLDRKATMPNVARIEGALAECGVGAHFFNVNAASHERRQEVIEEIERILGHETRTPLRLVMHSLAFGALRPFIAEDPRGAVTPAQLEMTLDVMAHSLVYWAQALARRHLIGHGTRIVAMTSAGGGRVLPSYGPVSAAKAALESHVRQLALELAPTGVTVNALRAGVTETPALRAIPGHDRILQEARRRNPAARLTEPADVARAIAALCLPETQWMSGGVIGVDGGEDVVG
jgi:NAD(P)-dependent dehydrogenase (short-subunit alcohol dehydrogenase family)